MNRILFLLFWIELIISCTPTKPVKPGVDLISKRQTTEEVRAAEKLILKVRT
ncbi:MAG: hypothetical protein IPL46_00160 [Saprospiraceae bacterium]|nr:hypothetical protein [Saprospiraceae bacterium]